MKKLKKNENSKSWNTYYELAICFKILVKD